MPANTHNRDYDNTPDEALMKLAARGDTQAFTVLVRRHQNPLLNFFRRLGVRNSAEDLVQETFIRLFKYRKKYKPTAKLTTFLYMMARQVRIDYIRKSQRRSTAMGDLAKNTEIRESISTTIPDKAGVAVEALRGLTADMREVVVLNVFQGLRYQEIADVLGIPLGTVKTRMFYALRKLREIMSNEGK
jgi:RNA polymerase sigma-70 factor (ECF subfamily)